MRGAMVKRSVPRAVATGSFFLLKNRASVRTLSLNLVQVYLRPKTVNGFPHRMAKFRGRAAHLNLVLLARRSRRLVPDVVLNSGRPFLLAPWLQPGDWCFGYEEETVSNGFQAP